jgi:hypothetical protein
VNPRLKIFIRIAVIVLLLIIGTALLLSYLTQDKIRLLAIEQLNSALETEVKVDAIEFSLLRKFPKASIQFKNISIAEKSNRKEKQNLIEAQSLFLAFDPFDLITGNYVINEIYVENALIRITYFADGTDNFHFFKSDSTSEDFNISLKKVRFSNSNLIYRNLKFKEEIRSAINTLDFSGDFDSDQYDMKIQADGNFDKFSLTSFRLRRAHSYNLNLVLGIDQSSERYVFNNASVSLGNIKVAVQGYIQNISNGTELDISFNGEDTQLSSLKDVFPISWKEKIEDYQATGIVDINGHIVGKSTHEDSPEVTLSFTLEEGKISHKKSQFKAENISFKGSFSNGLSRSKRTSVFAIDTLFFKGIQGNTYGKLKISNFDNPQLQFDVSSIFDLHTIKELLGKDSLETLEGTCRFNFKMKTALDSISSIKAKDVKRALISGSARLDDVTFKYKGMPHSIRQANGLVSFESNFIKVESFSCVVSGNKLVMEGRILNLIPFLFYPDEHLTIKARLQSPRLSVDQLMTEGGGSDNKVLALPLSKNLTLGLDILADTFLFKQFQAINLKGQLHSNYPELLLQGLEFSAMEGTYAGSLQIKLREDENLDLTSDLELLHVNITELFREFENFGQSNISSDNLRGYANIQVNFESVLTPSFSLLADYTHARAKIEILNGELLNYKPVLALSKYVDVEELNHIKFSRLSNEIEIKDRVVIIPDMIIKSSALELTLSGKHSFNNEIEYHFQLYLNDFLFRKAKRSNKNQTEFGEITPDESGRARLYIRMEGTVDDYKIRLDRKVLREQWNDELKDQRTELKELFRQEFKGEKKKEEIKPINFDIEWEGQSSNEPKKDTIGDSKTQVKTEKKKESWLDKVKKEDEKEYETYDPSKFD